MKYNTSKIKGLMAENGEKQEDLAMILGKARATINRKLKSGRFKQYEIDLIASHYYVAPDIFLIKNVTNRNI